MRTKQKINFHKLTYWPLKTERQIQLKDDIDGRRRDKQAECVNISHKSANVRKFNSLKINR